jgi:hypothetical protein
VGIEPDLLLSPWLIGISDNGVEDGDLPDAPLALGRQMPRVFGAANASEGAFDSAVARLCANACLVTVKLFPGVTISEPETEH